jgi:FKBP-type peptidyl-prolyl cis-trans isomerase
LLDGKAFDSNTDEAFHHQQPLEVEVGRGRVIKGWDEGLQLLKHGSEATFYIPSTLAYGEQGPPNIGPNAILVFDVKVLTEAESKAAEEKAHQQAAEKQQFAGARAEKRKAQEDQMLQDYFAKNNIKATKTPSGLYYTIQKEGTGEKAKPGQKVSMGYIGKTLEGKVFDRNVDDNFQPKGSPFTFTLGAGQVIKGWDEGIALLKKGSKATLYIPSGMAYGERGAGGAIPADAILIFDVEVLGIE